MNQKNLKWKRPKIKYGPWNLLRMNKLQIFVTHLSFRIKLTLKLRIKFHNKKSGGPMISLKLKALMYLSSYFTKFW